MNRTRARGWMLFAATLLLLTGAINLIQGAFALFLADNLFTFGGDAFFFGLGPWGFLLGLWGLLLLASGFALTTQKPWARVLAVVLAAINIVAQLAFVAANPLWSLVVIAINLLAIYALTAGWSTASEPETEASYRTGYSDAASGATASGTHVPQPSRGEHAR